MNYVKRLWQSGSEGKFIIGCGSLVALMLPCAVIFFLGVLLVPGVFIQQEQPQTQPEAVEQFPALTLTDTPTLPPTPSKTPTLPLPGTYTPTPTATRVVPDTATPTLAKMQVANTPLPIVTPLPTKTPIPTATLVPLPTATLVPQTPSHPSGATAICRDGSYSYSANRRGTCSHHGGVSQWLR